MPLPLALGMMLFLGIGCYLCGRADGKLSAEWGFYGQDAEDD